ncbi:MAG TPA: aminotransferase class III-fold pyridoxal phosphate-dependent enzyme, partial [Candidatus Limnocylindrales bacterium]
MAIGEPSTGMALRDQYLARTPRSAALFERATRVLPGGSTRTTVFAPPYPPYLAAGSGIRVEDVDGNSYRDFLGNYTALILGHAHPRVVAAVEEQV